MERDHPVEVMKIAFLRTDDLTGLDLRQEGGSYSHIGGFVRALQQLGHEVFFIASGIPSNIRDGSTRFFLTEYAKFFRGIPDVSPISYNFLSIPKALSILRKEKPDFMYQRHSVFNCSGVILSRLLGVPLILEVNASEAWVQANWARLYLKGLCRLFEEVAFLGADAIVVISEVVRQDLIRLGVEEGKIIVNPNGVDPEIFRPDIDGSGVRAKHGLEEKTVVGFLGTFGVWHGVPVLAEAIRLVIEKNPGIHFLLIGDGNLRPAVEKKIEEHDVKPHVTSIGIAPHEEVPALLAACDILVSPHVPLADGSEFFGSPTKLFEYMAMGKGIVASRLGQIGEVLRHEENALLVEPGNREDLAEGILRLSKDGALRERLGTRARPDVIANYTWRQNAERVVEVAENLLGQRGRRRAKGP